MSKLDWKVLPSDLAILREIATKFRRLADSDANRRVVDLWYKHDRHEEHRPLILTEFDGGLEMVLDSWKPRCQEEWAQLQERALVEHMAHVEIVSEDYPLEPCVGVMWVIDKGNWGVQTHETQPETNGTKGACHIDAVIELPGGLDKLKPRVFSVDRELTQAKIDLLSEVYDGLLTVRLRRNPWWTMGLTQDGISLIGLENMMMYMYDQPEALHQLMAFLRDDHLALARWMEREGLLVLNNENDYVGSGSRGYTRELPLKDLPAGKPPRMKDLWALIESQETVGVGPHQYGEFIFPYEEAIAREFGRVYYGCCEPINTRWEVLKKMSNLKRLSISPWCDQEFMAAEIGNRYIYSRKPKPTLVSTERFDEDLIRQDLRTTMQITKAHHCPTEIVMKDVHTLNGEADRLTRWVSLVRQVSREVYGE